MVHVKTRFENVDGKRQLSHIFPSFNVVQEAKQSVVIDVPNEDLKPELFKKRYPTIDDLIKKKIL